MPNDGDIRADPNPQWPMAYTYESRPCVITSGICDQEATGVGVQETVVEADGPETTALVENLERLMMWCRKKDPNATIWLHLDEAIRFIKAAK